MAISTLACWAPKWALCTVLFCQTFFISNGQVSPADGLIETSALVTLTDESYDRVIREYQYVLVNFYAPWCTYCKELAPKYAAAASQLSAMGVSVVLAELDTMAYRKKARELEITRLPTLRWYVDGTPHNYTGRRETTSILKWVLQRVPIIGEVETIDDLALLRDKSEVFFLAYMGEYQGEAWDSISLLLHEVKELPFYATKSPEVAHALGLSGLGYVMYTNFTGWGEHVAISEGHPALSTDKDLLDQLWDFMMDERLPPYLDFVPANRDKIYYSGINTQVFIVGSREQLARGGEVMGEVIEAHRFFGGGCVFVRCLRENPEIQPFLRLFGTADGSDVQVFATVTGVGKYVMQEEYSPAALGDFTAEVLLGEAEEHYFSLDPPSEGNEWDNGVYVVVGKTFDLIARDPQNDVLMLIYAPWCNDSQAMLPVWEEIAEEMREVEGIIVAKMDHTTNEHPHIRTSTYPFIAFFPSGTDFTVVLYEGQLDKQDLLTWIRQHATVQFPPDLDGHRSSLRSDDPALVASHSEL